MENPRIIDLSYPISSEMLVYPSTERPTFSWIGRANSEGYNLTRMTMLVHTGTHTDAPLHFLENVSAIDELPLDHFLGRCKLFRYQATPNSQEIGLEEVLATGFDLDENDIFVLSTGIETFAETQNYNLKYPYPSLALVAWLVKKKIKAYMTDATSVDPVEARESPRHKAILGAGIPIVENLCNLRGLPVNEHFLISALPLRLVGREGSPCRAVAML